MIPLHDSPAGHRKRKIFWKYQVQAKPDMILREKITRASSMKAWRESWGLWGRDMLGRRADDLKITIDNCPDSQPLPVAPGATSSDHD
jgi:hypothetical protein